MVSTDGYSKVDRLAGIPFNFIARVSTITIQIPIQVELDKKFSLELIEQLISTDFIYRRIPMLLLAIVNFIMLYLVVKHASNVEITSQRIR